MAKKQTSTITAKPVKGFFVNMLTRDIDLDDAILDLLDNCLDGAVRTLGKNGLRKPNPYSQFHAHITITPSRFRIEDNCGGIPADQRDYAFQMGRPPNRKDSKLPTVGAYGIGMKRAIFKIGRNSTITTTTTESSYAVEFNNSWFLSEDDWDIPLLLGQPPLKANGTRVEVTKLLKPTSDAFSADSFLSNLHEKIATYYAFVIAKGFNIYVNDERVVGKPIRLRFSNEIKPFIFKSLVDSVETFMAVGFTQPVLDEEDAADGSNSVSNRYRKTDAGWTIVCNDRVVVYCDRTEVTGWGEALVPRYHNQFISISGIVEFTSDDASKLPTTTTKRGIDGSSVLYLKTKNKMREGTKLFTDFTNRWKSPDHAGKGKRLIESARSLTMSELKHESKNLRMTKVDRIPNGKQYKPKLPQPKKSTARNVMIQFPKTQDEITQVGEYLFGNSHASAARIGEAAFDYVLEEATE